EVHSRTRRHLDQLLRRHPQKHADQAFSAQGAGAQRRHQATIPAERSTSAPHMPGIPSIATTAAPTSCSVIMRPSADLETNASSASAADDPERSASSRKLRSIRGPATGPGDSVLTRTPEWPTSNARVEVRPMTAIFDAQYGVRWARGRLPETDATLITSPSPRSIIPGRKARHSR